MERDFKSGTWSDVKRVNLSRVYSLKLLVVAVKHHGKPALVPSTSGQKLR